MRIGVDVGGTNTDAVLINNDQVLGAVKQPTSSDVSQGVVNAIQQLLDECEIPTRQIQSVMIGTTHFTNAFVQAKELEKIFIVRIGYPAARGVPPFSSWPTNIRNIVFGGAYMVGGGYEFDGRQIAPLDENAIIEAAQQIKDYDIKQVAISCIFSQLNNEHELRAAEILQREIPELGISLSSELGRVGLLERENAAIMNASLKPLAARVVRAFSDALDQLGIRAPYFISQNDGTLMRAGHMEAYPVLTFAAGPTNSLRGAAWLTNIRDAIVVDIGGTTADIGVIKDGFPRQSSVHVDIGGVRTNFRMPDIYSIGLGGGSKVHQDGDKITIGPDSVGFALHEEALIFGGDTLTASDIAVASGQASFGDANNIKNIKAHIVDAAKRAIHNITEDGIDRMKTSSEDVPMILVGGGSILISSDLEGVSKLYKPEYAGVANAVGAAIGQISGEVDRIYNIEDGNREEAFADARKIATQNAINAGADEQSVEIINLESVPLQYLPNGATRIICRAIGDLNMKGIAI